jgi:hypothetical protein
VLVLFAVFVDFVSFVPLPSARLSRVKAHPDAETVRALKQPDCEDC